MIDAKTSATELISAFYKNKDIGASNDLTNMVSSDLLEFLSSKAQTHQYVINKYGTYMLNYNVNAILLEKTESSDRIHFNFQVITTCNYVQHSDLLSTSSEEVQIVFDKKSNIITEFCCPYSYYDIAVRDSDSDSLVAQPDKDCELKMTEDIKERAASLIADIDYVYTSETTFSSTDSGEPNPMRTSYLNADNVVTYARNNYYKDTPNSGNGVVPYYDYSELSDSLTV